MGIGFGSWLVFYLGIYSPDGRYLRCGLAKYPPLADEGPLFANVPQTLFLSLVGGMVGMESARLVMRKVFGNNAGIAAHKFWVTPTLGVAYDINLQLRLKFRYPQGNIQRPKWWPGPTPDCDPTHSRVCWG